MKTKTFLEKKRKKMMVVVFILSLFFTFSCKKDNVNDLGGDTQIALTEVGNTTSLYLTIGSLQLPGSLEVKSRDADGVVTYHASFDYSSFPEADEIDALVPDSYQDGPGLINTDIKLKITSEGYQDLFAEHTPFIMFRYNDGVGTQYKSTKNSGGEAVRTLTEKTGEDDFYWGGMFIKTVKVEQNGDAPFKKYTFRGNHRFGLVYVEVEMNSGEKAKLSLFPDFPL